MNRNTTDQPTAHEAASDEAGPRTLADKAREVLQAVSLGRLSPQDEARLEAIEGAEDGNADLSKLEDHIEFGDAAAVREFADDELGHECPGCQVVITHWVPTESEPMCRGCLAQAEYDLHETQGCGCLEGLSGQRVAS